MKVCNQQELAKDIMDGESRIERNESLEKEYWVLNPSKVEGIAVLVAFFVGEGTPVLVGQAIGLLAVLFVCGILDGIILM